MTFTRICTTVSCRSAHDEGPECGLRQDFVLATVSVAVSLDGKLAQAEEECCIPHGLDTDAFLHICFPCFQTCHVHLTIFPTHSRWLKSCHKKELHLTLSFSLSFSLSLFVSVSLCLQPFWLEAQAMLAQFISIQEDVISFASPLPSLLVDPVGEQRRVKTCCYVVVGMSMSRVARCRPEQDV